MAEISNPNGTLLRCQGKRQKLPDRERIVETAFVLFKHFSYTTLCYVICVLYLMSSQQTFTISAPTSANVDRFRYQSAHPLGPFRQIGLNIHASQNKCITVFTIIPLLSAVSSSLKQQRYICTYSGRNFCNSSAQ